MQKGVWVPSKNSTHMHILIWLYNLFSLLGPVFYVAIYAVQVCFLFFSFSELHQKALLEIGRKEATQCIGEESYTLSDLSESFEEQGYILIQKSFKNPSYLAGRAELIWFSTLVKNFLIEKTWKGSSAIKQDMLEKFIMVFSSLRTSSIGCSRL